MSRLPGGPFIPLHGNERLAFLSLLRDALAEDAQTSVAMIVAAGWHPGDAADSYRAWFLSLADSAIDLGVARYVLTGEAA